MIDVIYELTQKEVDISHVISVEVFSSTKAPGVDLFNTRFNVEDYQKLVSANIPGFEILAAAYPANDVESMLANRQLEFTKFEVDEQGNTVEVADVLIDEQGIDIDIRIAPTEQACDRYREIYPDHITHTDEDMATVTFSRGNFSRHGK